MLKGFTLLSRLNGIEKFLLQNVAQLVELPRGDSLIYRVLAWLYSCSTVNASVFIPLLWIMEFLSSCSSDVTPADESCSCDFSRCTLGSGWSGILACGDLWKAVVFPPSTSAHLPVRNLSNTYQCSRGFVESSRWWKANNRGVFEHRLLYSKRC